MATRYFALLGQSNASGRGQTTPYKTANNNNVRLFDNDDNLDTPAVDPCDSGGNGADVDYDGALAKGSLMIPMLNQIEAANSGDVIVGWNANKGSTGFTSTPNWADTGAGTLRQAALDRKASAGGVDMVVWYQGESDTGCDPDDWVLDVEDLILYFRTQWSDTTLPFVVVFLSAGLNGTDTEWFGIRNAVRKLMRRDSNLYGVVASDLPATNNHIDTEELSEVGKRAGNVYNYILGKSTYWRGPVVKPNLINCDTSRKIITIPIEIFSGSIITATDVNNISDFYFENDGAIEKTPSSLVISGSNLVATFASELAHGVITIKYLYKKVPDLTSIVTGNDVLSLPLEPFEEKVNVPLSIESTEDPGGSMPFYNEDNTARFVFTISKERFASDITNFTYIKYSLPTEFSANARTDGMDIQVYDSGGSKMPRVLTRFDKSTGECRILWEDSASSTVDNVFQLECGSGVSDANDTAAITNSSIVRSSGFDDELLDDSGTQDPLTSGSPAYTDGPNSGQKALSLDGTAKYAYFEDSDDLSFTSGNLSVFCVAKVRDLTSAHLFNKRQTNLGADIEYALITNAADQILWANFDANTGSFVGKKSAAAVTSYENAWYGFWGKNPAQSATACKAGISGTQLSDSTLSSGSFSSMRNTNADLNIGALPGDAQYTDMDVCEIRIFSGERSLAELQAYEQSIVSASTWGNDGAVFVKPSTGDYVGGSSTVVGIGIAI